MKQNKYQFILKDETMKVIVGVYKSATAAGNKMRKDAQRHVRYNHYMSLAVIHDDEFVQLMTVKEATKDSIFV